MNMQFYEFSRTDYPEPTIASTQIKTQNITRTPVSRSSTEA